MDIKRQKYIEEQKNNHIKEVKEYFLSCVGYSSEKIDFFRGENSFSINFDQVKKGDNIFCFLKHCLPLDPELSEENILNKNWDALNDSIGGGMILNAEKNDVIYLLTGFEKFSTQYPEAWELLSILYDNIGYIKDDEDINNSVSVYVYK